MFLYSYNPNSTSAKRLSKALGIKRIKHERSRFKGGDDKLVINWGAASLPDWYKTTNIINSPVNVACAIDKRCFLTNLSVCSLNHFAPEWSTDPDWAWDRKDEGKTIVGRKKLRAHSGEGIVVMEPEDDLVECPLYVEYIPKKEEYRVHMFRDLVIDVQRKIKNPKEEVVDWKVRSRQNGFIYVRNNINPDAKVIKAAKAVFYASMLDFGAVDVIWNEHHQRAYALEINTAPGLTGTTLDRYKKSFEQYQEDNYFRPEI